ACQAQPSSFSFTVTLHCRIRLSLTSTGTVRASGTSRSRSCAKSSLTARHCWAKYPRQQHPPKPNEVRANLSHMHKAIHPHKPPEPKARKPHMRRGVPPQAQDAAPARATLNGHAPTHPANAQSSPEETPTTTGNPSKAHALALLVIQR